MFKEFIQKYKLWIFITLAALLVICYLSFKLMGLKDYSPDIEKLKTENAVLQSNVDNLKKENLAYEAKNRVLESNRSVLSDSVDVLNDKIEKIKKDHGKKNGNIDNLDNAQLIDYFSKHLSKTN